MGFVKRSSQLKLFGAGIPVAAIAICTTALVFSPGCGKGRDSGGGSYKIPWPGPDGSYSLQNVPISTYDSPQTLQGRFVNILVDPSASEGRLSGAVLVPIFVITPVFLFPLMSNVCPVAQLVFCPSNVQ